MSDTRRLTAQDLVSSADMPDAAVQLARERALAQHEDGLRQYFAISLGSRDAADVALGLVRRRIEQLGAAHLDIEPGPRAQLYRLARQVLGEVRGEQEIGTEGSALDWFEPQAQADQAYRQVIQRLRGMLSAEDRELLGLRYARGLTPHELSHVLDLPIDDVISRLELAAGRARAVAGEVAARASGGLRVALQEALSLAPSSETRHGSYVMRRPPLENGTVLGERYELERCVGEGAFGDVYRARDRSVPGHVVALKLLHEAATSEEARRTALRELRLIASVFHPSVVDFKDHGWHEDRLWFVMPWYEGETLEARMLRAPLSRQEALDIFVPLAQALSTVHHSGIRHQDIKPDNIFLAEVGDGGTRRALPVLIDLGVAAEERERLVAGTPLYFAPEIAARYVSKPTHRTVTAKADVFSLVLSLRNALEPSTRELVATTVEDFVAHRADHAPRPPRGKDLRYLAPFFERWLALEPDDRPTAAELADELRVLVRPEERRAQRRAVIRWASPLLVAAALSVAGSAWVYGQARRDAELARFEALDAKVELSAQSSAALALQKGHAALELSHRSSLEAFEQLADRLARQQKRGRRLREALHHARAESERILTVLDQTREELLALKAGLGPSGTEPRERERTDELTQRLEGTRGEAEALALSLTDLEDAVDTEHDDDVQEGGAAHSLAPASRSLSQALLGGHSTVDAPQNGAGQ